MPNNFKNGDFFFYGEKGGKRLINHDGGGNSENCKG